jgi:hypothetical protein
MYRNTGHTTLFVTGVESGCGCGAVPGYTVSVAPGATGFMELELDTTGVAEERPVSATVRVQTNDPKRPQVLLELKARVHSEFYLSANAVTFRPSDRAVPARQIIHVAIDRATQATLLEARSTDPRVTVRLNAIPPARGGGFDVVVAEVPTRDRRTHFGNIVVTTSSTYMPTIRIPVSG